MGILERNKQIQEDSWKTYKGKIMDNPDYDDDVKDILLWMVDYAIEKKWSLKLVRQHTGIEGSVFSRVCLGKYEGTVENVINTLVRFRSIYDDQQISGGQVPYIHTSLAEEVWQAAEWARSKNQIVIVSGLTQRGKTWAAEAYHRKHRTNTILIRLSVSPTPGKIASEICAFMGMKQEVRIRDCEKFLKHRLTPNHLLIVDEVTQVLLKTERTAMQCLEFFRWIFDVCHCPVLLIGTEMFVENIANDFDSLGFFQQVKERGRTFYMPRNPSDEDLEMIWEHYGLSHPGIDSEAWVKIKDLTKWHGLRLYTENLQSGYAKATRDGEPYTWQKFLAAVTALEKKTKRK